MTDIREDYCPHCHKTGRKIDDMCALKDNAINELKNMPDDVFQFSSECDTCGTIWTYDRYEQEVTVIPGEGIDEKFYTIVLKM